MCICTYIYICVCVCECVCVCGKVAKKLVRTREHQFPWIAPCSSARTLRFLRKDLGLEKGHAGISNGSAPDFPRFVLIFRMVYTRILQEKWPCIVLLLGLFSIIVARDLGQRFGKKVFDYEGPDSKKASSSSPQPPRQPSSPLRS